MSAQGFRLYDPTAEPCVVTGRLAPRLVSLAGKCAGILDNGKPNAGTLRLAVTKILEERTIARDGYTKKQVREFLFEHARFPLARLGAEYRRQQIERHNVVDSPATMARR
ncbi:MAG: hypothetical protein DMD95_05840 [Candidatus Rokuibacteriota bacterium]|nr:MAG: hypothetical protein DMD95_05840 [Candidatus Rokubacteria bacterium]